MLTIRVRGGRKVVVDGDVLNDVVAGSDSARMGSPRRGRILLLAAVSVIAASVWYSSLHQRGGVVDAFRASQSGSAMLAAMVDQETGLRGFQLTGREEFLRPFEDGRRAFIAALVDARRYAARVDRAVRAELDRSEQISRRWLSQAEHAVELRRGGARTVAIEPITRRKHLMDSIRASDARLQHLLDRRRDSQLARSGRDAVIVILLLSALFGVAGYVLVWRGGRAGAARDSAERRYRDSQAHFADTTQISTARRRPTTSSSATSSTAFLARASWCCGATTAPIGYKP